MAVPPTHGEAALPGIMEVERRLLVGKQRFQYLPGIQQSDIILHRLQKWATVDTTGGGRAPFPSEITDGRGGTVDAPT